MAGHRHGWPRLREASPHAAVDFCEVTLQEQEREITNLNPDLSVLTVSLLKGALYQETDPLVWSQLIGLQPRIRDYVSVLGLDLILDESEGYAFLRSRPERAGDDGDKLPRLIARRPLSFPVSLLLALLRRKLAESDASGGETRLVLTRDQIVELIRLFLPETTNEVKLVDQIETHINKIVELGFLRRLKPTTSENGDSVFEVRRILKAFVDAQWLADFDARLAAYRAQVGVLTGASDNE